MAWTDSTNQLLNACISTFGRDVVYQPLSGPSYPISGIFADGFIAVDTGYGVPITSTSPTLGVKLAHLAAKPANGDRVTVKSILYKIVDSQEDGEGGSLLFLQKL